jgi:hypothetical protein
MNFKTDKIHKVAKKEFARLEVFTATKIRVSVLWDVAPPECKSVLLKR